MESEFYVSVVYSRLTELILNKHIYRNFMQLEGVQIFFVI